MDNNAECFRKSYGLGAFLLYEKTNKLIYLSLGNFIKTDKAK